jgi:hypothetical protein
MDSIAMDNKRFSQNLVFVMGQKRFRRNSLTILEVVIAGDVSIRNE